MSCPKCGYENEKHARVCNLCGDLLNTTSSPSEKGKRKQRVLICNAFPTINLETNGEYTFGREKRNKVSLPNELLSRFHSAVIVDSDDKVFLEDRGSRNGTLLNGSRIHERTSLKLGDKITIGSYHIFFKEISDTLAPEENLLDANSTMPLSDLEGGQEGMVGHLAHMSVVELFNTFEFNQKTGVLHINFNTDGGKIFFREGTVLRAEYNEKKNIEAIHQLLKFNEGIFEFLPQDFSDIECEIQMTIPQILLDFARGFDEKDQTL